MKSWARGLMKRRGRIYIMPTRMGGYFNGLIFLMFFLSIGYSNNLLLVFTLLLFGLNLVWVIQTHFHMRELKLGRAVFHDGHAGESVPFNVTWASAAGGPHRSELTLESNQGTHALKIHVQGQEEISGEVTWRKRGPIHLRHLLIASDRPFGLYRTWRYVEISGTSYAYPTLSRDHFLNPLTGTGLQGETGTGKPGAGDVQGLLPYFGGDARRVSWKHYARSGELFVKEGEEEKSPLVELRWTPTGPHDKEARLTELATRMVICFRESIPFTFEREGVKKGPGLGARYLAECLRDLSSC